MNYLYADADGMTLACPACDMGQRWYVREDDTVHCRECGHECPRDDLVEREDERGQHTPREACAKGGRVSQARHGPPASSDESDTVDPPSGPDAKYADLDLDDVGLDPHP